MARNKSFKKSQRIIAISISIVFIGCLVAGAVYWAPYFTSTADFSNVVIHNYSLYQTIPPDEAGLICIKQGSNQTSYTIQNTNFVRLKVDNNTNQIVEIDGYYLDDTPLGYTYTQLGSLVVGTSTIGDVENEYGTHYIRHIFIDGYQSRISYFDKANRIELVFSFSNDVLVQIKLTSR